MSITDTIVGAAGLLLIGGVGALFLVLGRCLFAGVVKHACARTESA